MAIAFISKVDEQKNQTAQQQNRIQRSLTLNMSNLHSNSNRSSSSTSCLTNALNEVNEKLIIKLVIIVVYSTSQAQILTLHDTQATSLHHVDKSNVFYWLWEDLIAFFCFFFFREKGGVGGYNLETAPVI